MAKFEFYMKNAFFWGIYCWCSSKIAKIEIFRIFCSNYTKTVIFGFFYAFWKKKILKMAFINWKYSQLSEKCVFGALWCSRAKITRGGVGHPPQSWQAFLDVSLIRVNTKVGSRILLSSKMIVVLLYFFYYWTKPNSTPGHFIHKIGVNPF